MVFGPEMTLPVGDSLGCAYTQPEVGDISLLESFPRTFSRYFFNFFFFFIFIFFLQSSPTSPRAVHQPGQAIKITIAEVTGMHKVYSNRRNPSLGELQLFWVLRPRLGVAEDQHTPHQVDLLPRGGCRTLRQEFLDPCTGVQSKRPERPVQMHMGIHCIRYQDWRLYPDSTILFPTPPATD